MVISFLHNYFLKKHSMINERKALKMYDIHAWPPGDLQDGGIGACQKMRRTNEWSQFILINLESFKKLVQDYEK